jgi:predicted O-linked N-acetylglucosamine transferase (SPINDLY family)
MVLNAGAPAAAALQQALALYRGGNAAAAVPILRSLAEAQPRDAQVLFYLGTAELQLGHAAPAAEALRASLRLAPNPNSFNNLGLALQRMGRPEEALPAFDRAIQSSPGFADAHYNRAVTLQALGRLDDALAGYEKAVRLQPDFVNALNNKAVVLRRLGRPSDALACLEQALRLQPASAEAHNNRGNALADLKRPAEALHAYERALQLRPGDGEAHRNRGGALAELGRPAEAVSCFERAIALNPADAEAHHDLARALQDLGRLDEAVRSEARAIELKPDNDYWSGDWLYARLAICDWSGLPEAVQAVGARIETGERAALPFVTLLASDSPSLQKRAAQRWVNDRFPPAPSAGRAAPPSPSGKLRLAYLSADFHLHATMHLLAEVLEQHDRSRFELIGLSFGPQSPHPWAERARTCFDRFFDVRTRTDTEVAALAREIGVDVAVDLNGFTRSARPGILAARCAPVQVGFLGYPGTTGAPFIDYLVADRTVVPEEARGQYTEKLAYLPHCYQANRRHVEVAAAAPTRADCGLPAGGFVFCCFNGSNKILPAVFDTWMRILAAVDGSVLWLFESNRWAAANLRAEAQRRGVDPQRLVFAPPLPVEQHLARIPLADLFLDTLPYNAHTTASDALRMGVPLLTRIGETFAGRVAASLLRTLGVEELIAGSAAEYEQRAVALATEPQRLQAIRGRLPEALERSPLYDSTRFARDLEHLYEAMHARQRRGLPPEHLFA